MRVRARVRVSTSHWLAAALAPDGAPTRLPDAVRFGRELSMLLTTRWSAAAPLAADSSGSGVRVRSTAPSRSRTKAASAVLPSATALETLSVRRVIWVWTKRPCKARPPDSNRTKSLAVASTSCSVPSARRRFEPTPALRKASRTRVSLLDARMEALKPIGPPPSTSSNAATPSKISEAANACSCSKAGACSCSNHGCAAMKCSRSMRPQPPSPHTRCEC